MKGKKITQIGEFPPPYDGVSTKNAMLYSVFKEEGSEIIDLVRCRKNPIIWPWIFFQIVISLIRSSRIIIAVGTYYRLKFLLFLQRILLGERGLNKIVLVIMGGRFHTQIENDKQMKVILKQTRQILVESKQMEERIRQYGILNVDLLPSVRDLKYSVSPTNDNTNSTIKLVFLNNICMNKGINIIIQVLAELDARGVDYSIAYYGKVLEDSKEIFYDHIATNPRATYEGVIDSTDINLFQELNKYDVMLLVSQWIGEGVSNSLVESKMAGITAVVNDWNYNAEVIIDGVEGIVVSDPLVVEMCNAIENLSQNRELLRTLKEGAYQSRRRYSLDNYTSVLKRIIV